MNPVAKRRLDIDGESDTRSRIRTRADDIADWQKVARHEYHQSSYGPNPFRVGDAVEVWSITDIVWRIGKVTRVGNRFEHYSVHVTGHYDGVLGPCTLEYRMFAFRGIKLYQPTKRARALQID